MKILMLAAALICALASAASLSAAEGSKIAETKAEYVKKARADLAELSGKIDALELKAKKAGAEARADAQKQIKELKAGRSAAKKDLSKLKSASGGAWTDFKAGVDKAIADLKKRLTETKKD